MRDRRVARELSTTTSETEPFSSLAAQYFAEPIGARRCW
jgi:hypothetical protein